MEIQRTTQHSLLIVLGAVSISSLPADAATPNGNIVTIENPGGGTIAYTRLAGQQTLRSAMLKTLRYASTHFGGRPQIARVLQSPDGTGLEVVFSIAPKNQGGQEYDGLAIVLVPSAGPAEAALLTDTATRFLTTIKPMLDRLQAQTAPAQSTSNSQASGSTAGRTPGTPSAVSTAAGSASAGSASAVSTAAGSASAGSASAMPAATAPPAPLHQVAFPDGSGAMGLPDGWRIVTAQEGDVIAKGPQGEKLQFGMPVSVIDPSNPQSRALGTGPGGTAPGKFVAIRYGTDGAAAFKSAGAQLNQKQHKAPPTYDFSVDQDLHDTGGGRSFFLFGDVDMHDGQGAQATWVQVGMSSQMMMGTWQMTVFQVVAPKQLAAQEMATVEAMFRSYQANVGAIVNQLSRDGAQRDAIFKGAISNVQTAIDNSDRQTAGMSNFLVTTP